VHGSVRAIAASQRFGRAVEVATPADALGVAGVVGEFLRHGRPPAVIVITRLCPLPPPGLIEIKRCCNYPADPFFEESEA